MPGIILLFLPDLSQNGLLLLMRARREGLVFSAASAMSRLFAAQASGIIGSLDRQPVILTAL